MNGIALTILGDNEMIMDKGAAIKMGGTPLFSGTLWRQARATVFTALCMLLCESAYSVTM